MLILLVGAVLSVLHIEPWSNYVLVAGAVVIIIRGAVRTRERDDRDEPKE